MAEATDVCLRMRSIRRKDFVFCALKIQGWQTSESRRLHLTPGVLDDAWLEDRFVMIREAATLCDLLVSTAASIGELLDQDMEKHAVGNAWETGYNEYCGSVSEGLGTDDSEETKFGAFFWRTARAVLEACEQRHTLSEWELLEQLETAVCLGDGFVNPPGDRKTYISDIFAGCLCYLHGWSCGRHRGGEASEQGPAGFECND